MELHPTITHQLSLETQLHKLFPSHNIHINSRRDAVTNPTSSQYLEVDVWLPDIGLCFEFQDEHHYKPTWYIQDQLDFIQQKDDIKKRKLHEQNLTLVAVPYWWDGALRSLQGTITFHRPDLRWLLPTKHCQEIAVNPPSSSADSPLMLASNIGPHEVDHVHHALWWVGEKWDGIRCYWDMPKSKLYSRQNVNLEIHSERTNILSRLSFDGEVWCGRGFFTEAVRFSLYSWNTMDSSFVRVVCFDEASLNTRLNSFETRYSLLLSQLSADHSIMILAPRFLCEDESVLLTSLQSITNDGGEGLMLRKTCSRYVLGVCKDLLKLKAYRDREALVVKTVNDGSIMLQLPTGLTLVVPASDNLLPRPVARGDIVTISLSFSKQGQNATVQSLKDYLASALSRPVASRIRNDLSWQDVTSSFDSSKYERHKHFEPDVQRFLRKKQYHKPVPQYYRKVFSPRPSRKLALISGGRSWKNTDDRRRYFDDFATAQGQDKLSPSFWYSVTRDRLKLYKPGWHSILQHYGGKLSHALVKLYPDIGLQLSGFKKTYPLQSWKLESNRKAYFDQFASSQGKDPLNPKFWYNAHNQMFLQYCKASQPILKYYKGKLSHALLQLYPNIGLQRLLLLKEHVPPMWKLASKQRVYFDDYARTRGEDPLNPNFWYTVRKSDLLEDSGGRFILQHYKYNLSGALMQVYPGIGLQRSRFRKGQSWDHASDRRLYFDKFAADKGADPRNPDFWYGITRRDFRHHPGYHAIVQHHKGTLSNSLIELYPDINFQRSLFTGGKQSRRVLRALFDAFAAAKGMDPLHPSSWYGVSPNELARFDKKYYLLVRTYGKMSTALLQLYPNIGLRSTLFAQRRRLEVK